MDEQAWSDEKIEQWNAAYAWAPVGSDEFGDYFETQARRPGHSENVRASSVDWRARVRADIRSSRYGGPGVPVPGLVEYRAGRRDRSITGSITFGSWARGRAFPQTMHFVAYAESGATETYAEWSLEHPQ